MYSVRYTLAKMTCIALASLVAVSCATTSVGDPLCGNGVIDDGEECDGLNLDGAQCTDLDLGAGTLKCHAPKTSNECKYDTSGCASSECGNNSAEGAEECDGNDLQGKTCQTLGYDCGRLACTPSTDSNPCTFDRSGCEDSPCCGDGEVDSGESCDGTNLAGATCESLEFVGGTLSCDASCMHVTTGCLGALCGNNVAETGEVCDGSDLHGETCASLNYVAGALTCAADCAAFDEAACFGTPQCGNGVIEGTESCDGTNLGGNTCVSQGYLTGELVCHPANAANECTLDASGCSGTTSCNIDVDLGMLQEYITYTIAGDLSQSTNENEVSCTPAFLAPNSNEDVYRFTLSQPAAIRVQYEIVGDPFEGISFALFSAAGAVQCDDLELSCRAEMFEDGVFFMQNLSAGTYYLIQEEANLVGAGFPYTVWLEMIGEEICHNGQDDDGDGLVDCDDTNRCCTHGYCIGHPACPTGFFPGSPCEHCSDCGCACSGNICLAASSGLALPGGICTSMCEDDNDCLPDFVCINWLPEPFMGGYCLPGCPSGSSIECRPGWTCSAYIGAHLQSSPVCMGDCTDSSQCTNTGTCFTDSGFCDTSIGIAEVGEACTMGEDCRSLLCLNELDHGAPGGYCTSLCKLSDPVCPGDTVCVNLFDTAADDGYCLDRCSGSADCRANYNCLSNPHNPPPADLVCVW